METIWRDASYGVRMLLKRPGFTALAVLTLALGIGANTGIFSVVDSVLLSPLPFRDPDRLVVLDGKTKQGTPDLVAYPNLQDLREQATTLEGVAAFVPQSANLTGGEQPERVRAGFVSANFFDVVGVRPALGRALATGEDVPGAERVVVVNNDLWQRRFGADPTLVGSVMVLNGEPFTVVGIMPADFRFPIDEIEVWLPAQYYPNPPSRGSRAFLGIGRVKPGIVLEEARVEMAAIADRLADAFPNENAGLGFDLVTVQSFLVAPYKPALLVLLGAVGFILLIACANMANLLLARRAAREREVALRSALGASRVRIIRQLLTESLLLGTLGGGLGLFVAAWGVDALVRLGPPLPGGGGQVRLDARVLAFNLTISLATSLLFGLVPALQLSRSDVNDVLKAGVLGEGRGRHWARSLFVVAQVALSLVLAVGAGLLLKSFMNLVRENPGFEAANLLTMEYRLPRNKYAEPAAQAGFHLRVVDEARRVPGVVSAAVVSGLPFSGNGGTVAIALPDRPAPPKGEEPSPLFLKISPEYFETVGIPLLEGRAFSDRDLAGGTTGVVVSRTTARTYWPNESPIGKEIRFVESDNAAAYVIGVVGDAKQYTLEDEIQPQIYALYTQSPGIFATLVVRTVVEPMSLSEAVRGAVWAVDPDQPVWKVRTVESLVERNVAPTRFVMTLMGIFGALALVLTAIGIYGVISYTVSQRTREIGIRMALGARAGDVFRLVIGGVMALTLAGIVVGAVTAFALGGAMSSLVYGVSTADATTFLIVSALLAAVSGLACYLPARRATRVDPTVALRYE